MQQLDKVFTFSSVDGDDDSPVTLLFSCLTGPIPREEKNTLAEQVANDPLTKELLGDHALIAWGSDSPYDVLMATNDLLRFTDEHLDNHLIRKELNLYYITPKGIKVFNRHETYNSCKLPQRLIVGCNDCLKAESTKHDCAAKQRVILSLDYDPEDDGATPENAKLKLKNRKTKLGAFTYISPLLTRTQEVYKDEDAKFTQSTYRDVDDHHFGVVAENSAKRAKASQERGRYKKFRAEVCPTCTVQSGCGGDKRCPGPYIDTEEQMAAECLRMFPVKEQPFTNKELLTLLHNCGPFPEHKRISRRRYWATLDMRGGKLRFILRAFTDRDTVIEYGNFKECVALLERYGQYKELPKNVTPLSNVEKALMYELLRYTNSPTRIGRWHNTSYPAIGLQFSPHPGVYKTGRIALHFGTNSWRSWAIMGHRICPWSMAPRTYADLYDDVEKISYPTRDNGHPMTYTEFHRKQK